jgi:UPF0755 protein
MLSMADDRRRTGQGGRVGSGAPDDDGGVGARGPVQTGYYLDDGTWVEVDPATLDPATLDQSYLEGGAWSGSTPGYYLDDGTWVETAPAEQGRVEQGYVEQGYDEDQPYEDDGYGDDDGYADDEYWDDGNDRGLGGVRRRHPVLVVFLAVCLIGVLLGGIGIFWASRQINPGGHLGRKVEVTIPPGSSSAEIGSVLAKAGVIHSGGLFRYYVKVEGSGPLLAGTYLLARNESYDEAISSLQNGPVVVTDKLVIPEGFTLHEIARAVAHLPGMHLSAAKFLALSSSGSVRSPLEPAGVDNLEGLVYPATYTINRTDSESIILEEMVAAFDQHMQAMGLDAGARKLHMTPYQVITVGSIIQGEAKFASQFPDTASVLYNRLASGTTLGADSTLVYALRQKHPDLNVSKINYEQPSPYNTRLNKGLPPTPIDNPSLPALAAAINPPHTNLEYFVAIKSDGTLGFASTAAGFNQLVAECQAAKTGC